MEIFPDKCAYDFQENLCVKLHTLLLVKGLVFIFFIIVIV